MASKIRALAVTGALLATSVVTPALAAGSHPGGAAAKAMPNGFDLMGSYTAVNSTTHQKLQVSLDADDFYTASQCSADPYASVSLNVGVQQVSKHSSENHNWAFSLACTDFVVSGNSATLVVPGSQLGSYGSLSLSFKPSSGFKTECTGDKSEPGSLKGSFTFDTGSSSKWGSIGGNAFSFVKPSFTEDYYGGKNTCHTKSYVPPCGNKSYDYEFSAPLSASASTTPGFGGDTYQGAENLVGTDYVNLNSPKEATRSDEYAVGGKAATVTGAGNERKVTIKGAGKLASGGAELITSGKAKSSKLTCKAKGKMKKAKVLTWNNGKLKNGKQPLSFHGAVGAPIKFGGKGSVSVQEDFA